MEFLFWSSCITVVYTYVGFNLVITLLARWFGDASSPRSGIPDHHPFFSIVVAAYNEEDVIATRLSNLLLLDYPPDKFEIVVASDGSRDRTVAIARSFADPRIKILEFAENRGRAKVHNEAVSNTVGDILVFTDAETWFDPNFLVE